MQDFLARFLPDSWAEWATTTTGMGIIGGAVLLYAFVWCRIFAKAGFHALFGLLMVTPATFIVPLILAFVPWPVLREARSLKRVQRAVHKADDRYMKEAG